jgi:hypothetical protein
MKGGYMKRKMVSYTLETLPPLMEQDRERLRALAARPDDEIDYSDIPPITPGQAKTAVRGYKDGKLVHPGLRKKQAA